MLTTSYWPTYKTFDIQIPLEIDIKMKHFNSYYTQKYNHRQLQWCYSMGNATIGAKFAKEFDLVVGTYQLSIIMLFNNRREYRYSEIKDIMKFDDDTCAKNLRSLMTPKLKLLDVSGTGSKSQSNFNPDDVISVNESFNPALKRNIFPLPVLEEAMKKEVVQEDRGIAIEAAIVRIMKGRRKLDHLTLVQEVITNLHMFKPQP